eukprot:11540.XXX_759251_759421_1 [CDS] Oithona nana genome sequencing.
MIILDNILCIVKEKNCWKCEHSKLGRKTMMMTSVNCHQNQVWKESCQSVVMWSSFG